MAKPQRERFSRATCLIHRRNTSRRRRRRDSTKAARQTGGAQGLKALTGKKISFDEQTHMTRKNLHLRNQEHASRYIHKKSAMANISPTGRLYHRKAWGQCQRGNVQRRSSIYYLIPQKSRKIRHAHLVVPNSGRGEQLKSHIRQAVITQGK